MSSGDPSQPEQPDGSIPRADSHPDRPPEASASPTDGPPATGDSSSTVEGQPEQPAEKPPETSAEQASTDAGASGETKSDSGAGEPSAAAGGPGAGKSTPAGPLSKLARGSGPLAARGLGMAKPASPSGPVPSSPAAGSGEAGGSDAQRSATEQRGGKRSGKGNRGSGNKKKHPQPRVGKTAEAGAETRPERPAPRSKVAVPNRRAGLPQDLEAELEAQLAAADIESMLGGSAGMADRSEPLAEGARVHGQVLKIHDDNVFVALGGPDEGFVPFEQFKTEPDLGQSVEVIVRGVSSDDGLYILSLPGGTVDVTDWEDLEEGSVVEATVTGSNSGGLECKVGGVKGFIPISQVTEYRVEDLSDFVDQKFLCVVTEASARRGNLVLSRRAVLEREREEKRKEQLEKIEAGDLLEGTVRSIKDFGAFVDLGGLDGLIHISKLSWDRVKHPSDVLEEGQKVKVKIDRIDKDTGKISLSYRDLLENPWDTAEADYAVGSVHQGTVTRIANFGCFVKLGPGVEGLVHISELAHHRVSRVDTMVKEGEQVSVKVLSFDRDSQKISLSIKAAQAAPADTEKKADEAEPDEPARQPAVKATHSGPLKGGNNRDTGGERFGLRW